MTRAIAIMLVLLSTTAHAQIRLYNPDTVCIGLDDFHMIAAKRAVADSLNRARARLLVQQDAAIANLRRQLALCDESIGDLKTVIQDDARRLQMCHDQVMAAQVKLGKQRGWATVGKVGVGLVSLTLVAAIANTLIQ